MITRLRKSKWVKGLAMMMVLNMLSQVFIPVSALALTSGPSQPEVQGFTPIGTSDMVDMFSGDYNYNIPLMDIGGYPINISYSSGISMDQEASWVGLGWSLNVGAITRNMRGIPDDFNGDEIKQVTSLKPTESFGITVTPSLEAFGASAANLSYSFGVSYSNYSGIGFNQSLGIKKSTKEMGDDKLIGNLGFSLSNSTQGGPSLSPYVSIKDIDENGKYKETMQTKVGLGFSSRQGVSALTLNYSKSKEFIDKSDATKKVGLSGQNGSGSISFNDNTYVPQAGMDRVNASVNLSFTFGNGIFGIDGSSSLSGNYSHSGIVNKEKTTQAFGYIFNHEAHPGDITLDFNREKDGAFSENSANIALTNQTYDLFQIAGQGVGGTFRPYRSNVGKVFDAESKSTIGASIDVGVEFEGGNMFDVGLDGSISGTTSNSGYWDLYNTAGDRLNNTGSIANDEYEGVYFKEAGEKTVDDDASFYNSIGNDRAVRIPIDEFGGYVTNTKNQYVDEYGNVHVIQPTGISRSERVKRNQSISYLKASEVSFFGINSYVSPNSKGHHIAEIDVTRPDGARYIYGIAAYNITQQEMTFSVSGGNCATGFVSYSSVDRSVNNNKGTDNYYSSTETPAYAHSYLLTAVLSSDYSDVDGIEGPSPGDLGSYTKFNYDANASAPGVQPSVSNYSWRTPIISNTAAFNEGLKSDPDDDKGSVVYGEKEVWFVQSIETKTYVAIFHTSNRQDAFEVAGVDGGIGTDCMQKLDSISLYSLPDYQANGNNAEPIKRVHFDYDYTLCPNVPNNKGDVVTVDGTNINANKGKLTLKRIWFTYGKSRKGKLNGYRFYYGQDHNNGGALVNPSYDPKAYDRWGTYKPNNGNCAINGTTADNSEFPYSEQDKSAADQNVVAWNLSTIKMPSGGDIKINYESDDYSFVQDRSAMRMFKVTGTGTSASDNPTNNHKLFDYSNIPGNSVVYDYLFFEKDPSDNNDISKYIQNLANEGESVYFRFMVELGSGYTTRDYVQGYFQIESYGVSTFDPDYYFIKVKKVNDGDVDINPNSHPIAKAAWQFGRKYNPRVVYDLPDPAGVTPGDVFQALASSSLVNAAFELFQGANGVIRSKNYGRDFVPGKSFIRLYNPTSAKIGGGYRVKKIALTDNWAQMSSQTGATSSEYGQEYSYELEDGKSSGVAAYEPTIGGDENPFRKPIAMNTRLLLAPDDANYVEEPFGESFFPGASIGYSRVTVKNLQHANVTKHATGKVVHEFYTTKDFPVLTERTGLQTIHKKTSIAGSLLNLALKDYMTASQGFLIELNDMNGKQKSQKVFAEGKNEPITSVEYEYQTELKYYQVPFSNEHVSRTCIDNTVYVIDPNGSVRKAEVGVEYDIVNDFRKSRSYSFTVGAKGNLATFMAAIFPGLVPTLFPAYNSETTEFKSVATTKVINRSGVLRKTIAYDLGSKVSTENLAWDAQTGEVLLTKTENDFNDPVYNFSYPAHWAYTGMAQAYQNIDYVCVGSIGTNGAFTTAISSDLAPFHNGDEVVYGEIFNTTQNANGKAWLWDIDNNISNGFNLIKKDGSPIASATSVFIKVIRSGHRNQQALSIGSVTSSASPLRDTNSDGLFDALSFDQATTKVLNASAVEFKDNWAMFCNQMASYNESLCEPNASALLTLSNISNYAISQGVFCNGSTSIPANLNTTSFTFQTWTSKGGNKCNSPSFTVMVPGVTSGGTNTKCELDIYCGGTSPATFPSGFDWSDIVSISNFTASSTDLAGNPVTGNTVFADAIAHFNNGTSSTSVAIKIETDCGSFGTCNALVCENTVGSVVNPFVAGLRGNWRAVTSYLYLSNRVQTNIASNSNNLNIRKDGHYTSFAPFWKDPVSGPWIIDPTNYPSWTWTSSITQYSPFGFEVENKDALERYSAAIYGYNNTLPKAVGANTDYRSMAFDGFEDYAFIYNNDCCKEQFNFFGSTVVNTQHHTGRYAVQINGSGSLSSPVYNLTSSVPSGAADDLPYTVKNKDIIGYYGPTTYGYSGNKKFVISFWVKKATTGSAYVFSYDDLNLQVLLNGGATALSNMKKSVIIDGWQRYEYEFSIPASLSGTIQFVFNNAAAQNYFLDDFRVHPFDGSMKTFVYDPKTFRLMAELDERNFATLYEYDEEGALLRIKKETERGIMTIQESRNHLTKKFLVP